MKATITDTGNGTSVSREITGTHTVSVSAVADAPTTVAGDAAGLEDHAVALNLSASLVDTDGSETLTVSILGVPDGFMLSHGTSIGGGTWTVPAASLSGLQLMPPQDWNGTLNLTLQATSKEAAGQTATTTTPFSVTVEAVNDAPELALASPDHVEAGTHHAQAIGGAAAEDIDSSHLGGATITLSGAQPGDRLDVEGFVLHEDNGRTMIGDTGIEIVGGGYAAGTGTLTLSGHASPEIYASVLEALVLESGDASGLAAGSRSLGVVLVDSEGAASLERSVDVVVDDVALCLGLGRSNGGFRDDSGPGRFGYSSAHGGWRDRSEPRRGCGLDGAGGCRRCLPRPGRIRYRISTSLLRITSSLSTTSSRMPRGCSGRNGTSRRSRLTPQGPRS